MRNAARQVTHRGEVIRSRRSLDRRDTIKCAAAEGIDTGYFPTVSYTPVQLFDANPIRRTLRGRYREATTEAMAATFAYSDDKHEWGVIRSVKGWAATVDADKTGTMMSGRGGAVETRRLPYEYWWIGANEAWAIPAKDEPGSSDADG